MLPQFGVFTPQFGNFLARLEDFAIKLPHPFGQISRPGDRRQIDKRAFPVASNRCRMIETDSLLESSKKCIMMGVERYPQIPGPL